MKKQLAEFLKLMSALGAVPGLKVGLKKILASDEFSIQLPGVKQRTWIRKNTSDWTAFKQVFIWKEYEYPIRFKPSTILDAGANVGYASQWFATKFPEAQIVSLEPESGNFNILEKNISDFKNIFPLKGGLWERTCFLRVISTDSGNWGFRTEEVETSASDTIKAFRIKDIMQERHWSTIDLLKMDIEGAESKVFAGDTSDWLPKVKMMFIELHDNIYRDCSKNLFKALAEYDFSVDISGENIVLFNNRFG
jgi:FkbM family methyltransferase